MLAAIGAVHVLAAASAEAHINDRAKTHLTGKSWGCFERIAAESKWLFFPRIVGCGTFEPGNEPYQGLARLFSRRNALVHYKPHREIWSEPGVPAFLEQLGLTITAAEDSLSAVRGAVSELARLLREERPLWLSQPSVGGFFEINFDHSYSK